MLVVADALDRNSGEGFLATLARWRWFWIPPLYAIALLVVLIVTLYSRNQHSAVHVREFLSLSSLHHRPIRRKHRKPIPGPRHA